MRIGVELRHVVPEECGGLVVLLQHALRAVFQRHPGVEVDLYCRQAALALFPADLAHVSLHELPDFDEGYFPRLDQLAVEHRIDVLLRSYPYDAPLAFPRDRQIVLVPDLQHESFPEFFDERTLGIRKASFASALSSAAALATLSAFTLRTIREHPATRTDDIFLIPPALPPLPAESPTPAELARIPESAYFLLPANLWPHKNHRRILAAFKSAVEASQAPVELVLTGHPSGWEALAYEFPGLPVRHLGYVQRPLLDALMRKASALLFFSLYEGFGIPLLEAFHAGCPVLCSNTTSLPEVGGDAVLSCDPTDIVAMSGLMEQVLKEPDTRQRLITAGTRRVAAYSWGTSADALVAGCARVAARATPWVPDRSQLERRPDIQQMLSRAARSLRTRLRRVRAALSGRPQV